MAKTLIKIFISRHGYYLFIRWNLIRLTESLWCFLQIRVLTSIVDFEYSTSKLFLIG